MVYWMMALLTLQRYDLSPINIPMGSMRLSELLAGGALLLFLLEGLLQAKKSILLPKRITMFIFLFLGVMFLSSFMSIQIDWGPNQYTWVRRLDREVPFIKSYTNMLAWLFGIAVFYATALLINSPEKLKSALRWWIIGGTVCSLIAIYSAPAATFGWPLGDLIGVSQRAADPAGAFGPVDILPRVYGLTGEPRHLVSFLVSLLPFLILTTLFGIHIIPRWAQRSSLAICGLAYLLTLSRSTVVHGIVLMVLLAALLAVREKRIQVGRVLRALMIMFLLLVVLSLIVQEMLVWFGVTDLVTILRLQIDSLASPEHNLSNWFQDIGWRVAWQAFIDHPILGVGLGNLSFYVDQYIPPKPDWLPLSQYFVVTPVNNLYLDILSEMGLLGLGAFALLMGSLAPQAWRAARRAGPVGRTMILGLLGGFLMLLIAYVFFSAFMFAYIWATIGLLFVSTRFLLTQPEKVEYLFGQKSA